MYVYFQSDEASLNQEAERIVSEMPDWIPGKQRGRPVPVKYTVPIRFGNIRFAENKQPLILLMARRLVWMLWKSWTRQQ